MASRSHGETVSEKRSKQAVVSMKSDSGVQKPASRTRRTVARKSAPDSAPKEPSASMALSPQQRHNRIAEVAYYIAERRGFTPGSETEDWLAAESIIDAEIRQGM